MGVEQIQCRFFFCKIMIVLNWYGLINWTTILAYKAAMLSKQTNWLHLIQDKTAPNKPGIERNCFSERLIYHNTYSLAWYTVIHSTDNIKLWLCWLLLSSRLDPYRSKRHEWIRYNAIVHDFHFRLCEDTFTIDEVTDLLDGLLTVVRAEVETELINSAHTNVLLLRQLFQQAEQWHLKLQADISELENRYACLLLYLLDFIFISKHSLFSLTFERLGFQ